MQQSAVWPPLLVLDHSNSRREADLRCVNGDCGQRRLATDGPGTLSNGAQVRVEALPGVQRQLGARALRVLFQKVPRRLLCRVDAGSLAEEPDECAAAGYANLRHGDVPAGRSWICDECFADFVPEYRWEVEEANPDSWPYDPSERKPRPTESDFDPDAPGKSP